MRPIPTATSIYGAYLLQDPHPTATLSPGQQQTARSARRPIVSGDLRMGGSPGDVTASRRGDPSRAEAYHFTGNNRR
jgi:hypothetical protein